MEYKRLIVDFAQRTRKNLEYIEHVKTTSQEEEVYEVTQLINSLLGLLVFPKEYYQQIPPIPLTELEERGWPKATILEGNPPCSDLRVLVRYLRNSVAHLNVEFFADSDSHELTSLKLWNSYKGRKTWEIWLTIERLRETVLLFISLLEEIFQWFDEQAKATYKAPLRAEI